LGVVVIFGALMGYYLDHNSKLRYRSELQLDTTYGKTLIRNFSSQIIFGLLSQDQKVMAEEAGKLLQDGVISYAVVYDPSFKVIHTVQSEDFQSRGFTLPAPEQKRGEEEIFIRRIQLESKVPFLDLQMAVKNPGAQAEQNLGWVRLGISLETLTSQLLRSQIQGYSLIGVVMVLVWAVIWISLRTVLPYVNRVVQAAQRVGQGDFSVQLEIAYHDEIGLLTAAFNEMTANLREKTRRLDSMIQNVGEAIQVLTATTAQLLSITTEQAAGATEQATIVQEVVATTEEIAATAAKISETAGSVNEAVEQTAAAADRGKERMESSIQGMEKIREQVAKGTSHFVNLAEQAQMISGLIAIINEISEQTNLLSLNAALEAAGAGEAGKRFSVVAQEVRRLAHRTLEATDSVRTMVETIQKSTQTMVKIAEDEQQAVLAGVGAVKDMGVYFQHILDRLETTKHAASEIRLITGQQSNANQQMVISIREVEKVAKEVEKGVKEVESSMSELNQLAERLRTLLEEKH